MSQRRKDSFGARKRATLAGREISLASLAVLHKSGIGDLERLPYCTRVMLENLLRN